MYKGKWLQRAKRIFEDGKRFAERVKGGQGVWYRPGYDVILLERGTMSLLSELTAWLLGEWKVGDVRALAVMALDKLLEEDTLGRRGGIFQALL